MNIKLPLTNEEGEVRELSVEDMAAFRPASHVLPPDLYAVLTTLKRRGRGANKTPTKEPISIRLSPEVVAHFRASGEGWQSRIDSALKEWVAQHL